MKIRFGDGLLPLNLLAILLVALTIFQVSQVWRIILGIPFALYFPGYTLLMALFPGKGSIGGTERTILSFALSIAIVPLIGLILNYTPWGITLDSSLYSIASFILLTSTVSWGRSIRLPKEARFNLSFQFGLLSWHGSPKEWALLAVFLLTAIGMLTTLGYVITKPKITDKFTEFYILGIEGKAESYPTELAVGEEGKIILGIANHEHEKTSYSVEVRVNGDMESRIGNIVLNNEERWEEIISFIAKVAGSNQKMELWLYKNGKPDPSLKPLYLWFNVRE